MYHCEHCGREFSTKRGLICHNQWLNPEIKEKRILSIRQQILVAFPDGRKTTPATKAKMRAAKIGKMPKNIDFLHSPEMEKRAHAAMKPGTPENMQAFWLTPEGRELHRQTALKMTEKRMETPEKKADWLNKLKEGQAKKGVRHDELIFQSIGNYEKAGYRCIPLGLRKCPRPDFVAVKDNMVFAVEVEQGIINYKQIDKYVNSRSYYNDIHYIWVLDPNGKRGKRPDDKRTVEKLKQIQGKIFKEGG